VPDLLGIGKSGLFAAKKSLETTGHNISNANTEGYTRQRVHQSANIPVTIESGYVQGTGTKIDHVNRIHDEFVEKRLNNDIANEKFFEERATRLGDVENIFNEVDNDGLNYVLNRFFNSFRELGNHPENEAIRLTVRDNAVMVIRDFHRISNELTNQQNSIDLALEKDVNDINAILRQIAHYNREIAKAEVVSGEACDLRDQRDAAIRSLSEYFEVWTYSDERGQYNVAAQNVGTLVSGGIHQELATGRVPHDLAGTSEDGQREIFFEARPSIPIGDKFKNGRLNALLKTRNQEIQRLKMQIDDIAFNFAKSVNAIHRRGFVNRPTDPRLPVDLHGPITTINFFEEPMQVKNAAKNLSLDHLIKQDLSNICTALSPNAPGDNRIALAISKLQHEKFYDDKSSTMEEKYLKSIAAIGLESGKAKLDHEQALGLLAQTQSMRERISGVSIDEETTNLVRYQHAYDASAKVLKTADENFRTLISMFAR